MDKTTLVAQMRPLSLGLEASSLEQSYFQYYGIDLENRLENIDHTFGYVDTQDFRIACHLYSCRAPKGSVFLLHGYYDHVGLFEHIIRFFLEQNLNVLAYDLPGHGLSSGESATIEDFGDYRQTLEDMLSFSEPLLPKPWFGYGQSTGCAIITDLLNDYVSQKQPLPFQQVILSAPLVRPYLWWLARIKFYIAQPFIKQIPRTFKENCRNKAFIQKAHSDPLAPKVLPTQWVASMNRWIRKIEASSSQIDIPAFILQGTNDTTVDGHHNLKILNRLYINPSVMWLDGARHHLPNEIEDTRTQYMNWLISKIKP
ncbi:alpha/beta hydrolase [Endozoicomonas ascidiicola]|uniref:alpha/beta hydrolase n=1 Tax=Endozoicomonas ascidiicola TaxID=1698521 RepID=UPI000836CF48|nr:alpha/beta fold hydrolase [Endozoicomonas ascidiicola]